MKPNKWLILLLLAGFLLSAASVVRAQEPAPTPSDDEVNAVAKQMYCPVCENIPLDVCPTTACREWRELIRLKLSEGWNAQQIKDYFALQYGDRVLSEPPARGLNWLVYVLPPVAFLAGAALLFFVLRGMRARKNVAAGSSEPEQAENPSTPQDEYIRRVEDELKQFTKR